MSITRDHRVIIVECDQCHETLETETADFDEARNVMEREQWRVKKVFSKWFNFCSHGCQLDFEKEQDKERARRRK
jgi:hypothetical protein